MTVARMKRKNMKHLSEMNDYDFCRWVLSRQDNELMVMNWKLDGFFLRFGKTNDGTPWFQTARSEVLYDPMAIIWYAMEKGYDHDAFTRAENYFHLIKAIWDSEMFAEIENGYGYDCEVFDRSMAKVDGDEITFVNLPYSTAHFHRPVTLHRYRIFLSETGETFLPNFPTEIQYDKVFGLYGSAFTLDIDFSYFREAVASLTEEGIRSLKSLRHADRALKLVVKEKVATIKEQLRVFILSKASERNKLGRYFEGVVIKVNNTEYKITTDEFKVFLSV